MLLLRATGRVQSSSEAAGPNGSTEARATQQAHAGLPSGVEVNCDLVSIDVGKRVSGVAVWDGTTLVECREVYARPTAEAMAAAIVDFAAPFVRHDHVQWVVESMVDYKGKNARKRDLEQLRDVVAETLKAARELPGTHRMYRRRAHRWKGAVPKSVTARRVWFELSEAERRRVVAPDEAELLFGQLTKETADAVGLGLVHRSRLGRGLRGS